MNISCIIPAYNEEKNIKRVLQAVQDYPFAEIMVIDDGSKDNTPEIVKQFKRVKLIRLKQNQGKSAAILTGIKAAKNELIVMLDSDLLTLRTRDIDNLIHAVTVDHYDMSILDRAGDRQALWGWTNCARFFGGERCFWKKDFQNINLPANAGFLIETIMNLQYIMWKKRITTIYAPNLYTVHDFKKRGWKAGVKHYVSMGQKIVRYASVLPFLNQILKVEEDRLRELYLLYNIRYVGVIFFPIVFVASLLSGMLTFIWLNAKKAAAGNF